jgi:hypothetical protein
MSKEAAAKFLNKVASDPKLSQHALAEAVSAGAKLGYQFSGPELREALQERWKKPDDVEPIVYYCCYSEPL